MREYDTYIFDFDGTLVDSQKSLFPVFERSFAEIGRHIAPKDAAYYMHFSLTETMEIAHVEEDKRKTFIDAILLHLDDPDSIAMIELFPETKRVIESLLAKGKNVAIASNNLVAHIDAVLAGLGMVGVFPSICGSDRVNHPKPAPDLLFLACQDLGVACDDRVCYVGDSLQDAQTGANAGIDGVLVDRGNEHPDFAGIKISSLTDLLL